MRTQSATYVLVRALIREFAILWARTTCVPSPRLDAEAAGSQSDGSTERLTRLADLSRAIELLSSEERSVIMLRVVGVSGRWSGRRFAAELEDYERTVLAGENGGDLYDLHVPVGDTGGKWPTNGCKATLKSGFFCRRKRDAGTPYCRLREHQKLALGAPVTRVTRSGGEFQRISENDERYAIVRETRARPLRRSEIADALGLTERQVKHRLETAYGKLAEIAHEFVEAP